MVVVAITKPVTPRNVLKISIDEVVQLSQVVVLPLSVRGDGLPQISWSSAMAS
jgi:hypothetical protein